MGCQVIKEVQPTKKIESSLPLSQSPKHVPVAGNSVQSSINRPRKLESPIKNMLSQQYSKSVKQIRIGKNLLAGMTDQNLDGLDLINSIGTKSRGPPNILLGSSLDAIPELSIPRYSLACNSLKKEPNHRGANENMDSISNPKKLNRARLRLPGLKPPKSTSGIDELESPGRVTHAGVPQLPTTSPSLSHYGGPFQGKVKEIYPREKVRVDPPQTSVVSPSRQFRVVLHRASSAERKQREPVKGIDLKRLLEQYDQGHPRTSVKRDRSKEILRQDISPRQRAPGSTRKQQNSSPRVFRKIAKPQEKLLSCVGDLTEGNQASISECVVFKGFKEDHHPKSGELVDTSTAFPSCQPKQAGFPEMSILLKSVSSKSEDDSDGSPRVARQSQQLQKAHMDTEKSEDSAILEMSGDRRETSMQGSPRGTNERAKEFPLVDRLEGESGYSPSKRGQLSLAAMEPGHFTGLKRKFGGRIVKFNSSRQEDCIGNGFKLFFPINQEQIIEMIQKVRIRKDDLLPQKSRFQSFTATHKSKECRNVL